MSNDAVEPPPVLTLDTVAGRVTTLAAEVATLRESIVTAAEWDAEARRARQISLDATLLAVRVQRLSVFSAVSRSSSTRKFCFFWSRWNCS